MLGEILRWRPKRLILFPERGLLQVELEDEKFCGDIPEKLEDYENILILRYSGNLYSFRIYALLWEEVEFYIKSGVKVEEFRGSLMERWERYLKGWDFEEVDNIIGKVYIAHRDAERGSVRFVRIGEEIKKLKFPPRKNFLAVFKGEQGFQSAIKFLKGFFEGVRAQFRSPENVRLLENYAIRVIGDSVVIVDVKRAAFRVIFDKLMGGRFSTRNLSIPLDIELPERVREILQKFGFGFSGERLFSMPDLPVNISIESLENFAKLSQNLEDEEVIVRNLARFLSEGRLKYEEILLSELLMCNNPYYDPEGKVIMMMIPLEEIREYFDG
ncbi:MAG: hypothetical protein ACO2O5_12765 [Candidatus Caldipriscus sp.]